MQDLEQKARQGQETADADKDAKAGDKRKKSGRAAGKNKKAKTEETGKTQVQRIHGLLDETYTHQHTHTYTYAVSQNIPLAQHLDDLSL